MDEIEWEWGYYGRCFVDGKFSHGVRIHEHMGTFSAIILDTDKGPDLSGLMLDTYTAKSLEEIVGQCQAAALKILDCKKENVTALKKHLHEYPFHHDKGCSHCKVK